MTRRRRSASRARWRRQSIQLSSMIPLLGGHRILYPCHLDNLTQLIYMLCMSNSIPTGGHITADSARGMSGNAILQTFAHEPSKTPVLVPVPSVAVLFALRSVEMVGMRTRLRRDTLVSLSNRNQSLDFRTLAACGVPCRDYSARTAV